MRNDRERSAREEVGRELRFHLEEDAERLVASGMSREEAWAEVRARAGPLHEIARECARLELQRRGRERRRTMTSAVLQDLRYGARALRRRPGFALAAVATIALGLGPATALYSVVDHVLLRPLPYPAPQELVRIGSTFPGGQIGPVPGPLFQDWERRGAEPFTSLAAILVEHAELPAEGGAPGRLRIGAVSASLGPMLGLEPAFGRWFTAADDRRGSEAVTVLSHAVWMRRWGGDPSIVGRPIDLDGKPVTVIGVTPAGFHAPEAIGLSGVEAWIPLHHAKQDLDTHDNWFLRVLARLPASVPAPEAVGALQDRSDRLIEDYPSDPWGEIDFTLQSAGLRDLTVGSSRETMTPLMLAVALLLLTASVNLAHLNLARGRDRLDELAVRGALGAGRGRLVGQLVMESLLTGVVGALLAVGMAAAGIALFRSYGPGDLPRLDEVTLDLRVLSGAGTLLLFAGVGFALVPDLSAVRHAGVQGFGRLASGKRVAQRGRGALVAAELAFALMLLAAAGLLGRSYWNLVSVDPGFRTDRVSALHLTLRDRYETGDARLSAYSAIRDRLAAVPGVEAVGTVNGLPFGDTGVGGTVVVEGRVTDPAAGPDYVRWATTDDGYFRALGIAALPGGRLPDAGQFSAAAHVAVVNQAFVARFLGGRPGPGARIQVGRTGEDAPWWEILAVIADMKQGRLDRDATPEVYVPMRAAHFVFPDAEFVVLAGAGARVDANQLRSAVWAADPNQPVGWVAALSDRIEGSVVAPRFHAGLLAFMALTAVLLAAAGVFGTVAYAITRRRRELAIRRALGATASGVRSQVVRENLSWVVLGLAVGVAGCYPLSRTFTGMLFGVEPMSFGVLAPTTLTLLALGVVASWVPAVRASRVEPACTLRE